MQGFLGNLTFNCGHYKKSTVPLSTICYSYFVLQKCNLLKIIPCITFRPTVSFKASKDLKGHFGTKSGNKGNIFFHPKEREWVICLFLILATLLIITTHGQWCSRCSGAAQWPPEETGCVENLRNVWKCMNVNECSVNLLCIDRGIKKRKTLFLFFCQYHRSHTCQRLMFPQFVIHYLARNRARFCECSRQLHKKAKTTCLHSNECFFSSSKLVGCLDWSRVKSAGSTFASATLLFSLHGTKQTTALSEMVCLCMCVCAEAGNQDLILVKENIHL